MFCKNCGEKMDEMVNFCNKCGESISGAVMIEKKEGKLPASMGKRFTNYLIDYSIKYLLYFIFIALGGATDSTLLYVIAGIIFCGYFTISESIWGVTIGKLITKTKVVSHATGKKPGFWRVLARSLSRNIPFDNFSFLFSSYPVGWHDMISKTLVVSKDLSAHDIKEIDLDVVKKTKSKNGTGMVVAIAVGALVLIAIVGILASVVLASLNAARNKAREAAKQADPAMYTETQ